MKLKKKQWATLLAAARSEGFDGDSIEHPDSRKRLIAYLQGDTAPEFQLPGGVKIDAKALGVEMSEDKRQVLVTEGAGEDPNAQQQPPPQNGNGNGQMTPDAVASMIQKALSAREGDEPNGVEGKRPDLSKTTVGSVKPMEQVVFEDRAKRGRTQFNWGDNAYEKAKAFTLATLCLAYDGGRIADPIKARQHAETLQKMCDSGEGHFKALGRNQHVKALASSPGSSAGAFMQTSYDSDILRNLEEYGVMLKLAPPITMTQKTHEMIIRTGGVSGYYSAENESITTSDPTHANQTLVAKDWKTLTIASLESLRDATPDIGDMLLFEHTRAMSIHIDDTVLKGDGTSTYGGRFGLTHPLGPSAPFGSSAAGSAGAAAGYRVVGGDSVADHDGTDLALLIGQLPVYARQGAVITGLPDILAQIFHRLGAAAGGVTMQEFQGTMVNAYAGFPMVPNFSMSNTDLSTAGDRIDALFGDFRRAIVIGIRENFSFVRDDSVKFAEAGAAFRGIMSWDFKIRDVGDSSTAGPVVAFFHT